MFHRNLNIPKLKYHFPDHHERGKKCVWRLLFYSITLANSEHFQKDLLFIAQMQYEERKGGGARSQISGFFPPRPCQGFENKYFKGSKGSKTIIQAPNHMGSLYLAANTSAGIGGNERKEQQYPSQTSRLKNAKAHKSEAVRSTAKLLLDPEEN